MEAWPIAVVSEAPDCALCGADGPGGVPTLAAAASIWRGAVRATPRGDDGGGSRRDPRLPAWRLPARDLERARLVRVQFAPHRLPAEGARPVACCTASPPSGGMAK